MERQARGSKGSGSGRPRSTRFAPPGAVKQKTGRAGSDRQARSIRWDGPDVPNGLGLLVDWTRILLGKGMDAAGFPAFAKESFRMAELMFFSLEVKGVHTQDSRHSTTLHSWKWNMARWMTIFHYKQVVSTSVILSGSVQRR